MEWQLRIYTINEGELDAWLDEWKRHVAPLRRKLGFDILGPWVDEASSTFVWLLGYDGADGYAAANERYYDSDERRRIDPDPARHIASIDERLLRDLGGRA